MTHSLARLLRHGGPPADPGVTDGELLRRYAGAGDQDAFAELVRRNGPAVLGVCRGVLRDGAVAEDTFQATFLLLARKAARLTGHPSVAGWLHAAAVRTARDARRAAVRRRRHESAAARPAEAPPADEVTWREVREAVDAELARLPERYRLPLVLCYLHGLSYAAAASRLGCTPPALQGRLERGRRLLRDRLARLGFPATAAVFLAGGPPPVSAALRAAVLMAVRGAAEGAGLVPGVAGLSGLLRPPVRAVAWVAVAAVGVGLVAAAMTPADRPAATPPGLPARPEVPPPPRLDILGDPLPPGAVARMGSARLNHGATVERVAVSPDGRWVVSADRGGYRLWETATGREGAFATDVAPQLIGRAPDGKLAVSATRLIAPAGGRLLAVVAADPGTRIVDAITGAEVRSLPAVVLPRVQGRPVLSADGRWLAWIDDGRRGGPGKEGVWAADLAAGESVPVQVFASGPRRAVVYEVRLSADGTALAVSLDDAVEVWDVPGRRRRLVVPLSPAGLGCAMALAPDGRTLAVAQPRSPVATLWDVPGGAVVGDCDSPLRGGDGSPVDTWIATLNFSPDGKRLAATADRPSVRVWDVATRKKVTDLIGANPFERAEHAAFTPDGRHLVGCADHVIEVWEVATGRHAHPARGHGAEVWRLTFSGDGRRLVTASANPDTTARVWDPATGRETATLAGHRLRIGSVAAVPGGRLVATGGYDQTVRLWDAATGTTVRTIDVGENGPAVAVTPDGRQVVAAGFRLRAFDSTTGTLVRELELPRGPDGGPSIEQCAFTPDGKALLLRRQHEPHVDVWDWAAGEPVRRLAGGGRPLNAFAVAADGRRVALGSNDGSVRVVEVATGRELVTVAFKSANGRPDDEVVTVAVSPDGRLAAATARGDPAVRVWEVASGGERFRFPGHRSAALALAFSPDGAFLATGGKDRTALCWDLTGRLAPTGGPEPKDLAAAWADLAAPDAARGFAAVRFFAGRPDDGVRYLADRLKPVPAADPAAVAGWIARLDSPRFADREAATADLARAADGAEPQLRAAAAKATDPEARDRLNRVLATLDDRRPTGERLRVVRAVEALERAGSPAARAVLEALAAGAAGARTTRDAGDALGRLPRR